MEAGVPGIFMRIAEIPPEKMAEFHTPIRTARPFSGLSQKVRGAKMATAVVAVSPGKGTYNQT